MAVKAYAYFSSTLAMQKAKSQVSKLTKNKEVSSWKAKFV